MPLFLARGTVVKYSDSIRYTDLVSESFQKAAVLDQIWLHSSGVG